MRPTFKKRKGITLIDVTIAAVIMSVGTMFLATYFTNVYEQLSPRGSTGLRRYLLAEQMLKAQAEALRVFNPMPSVAASKVITEPAGLGYSLGITRFPVAPAQASEELLFHDLTMTHTIPGGAAQTIGVLSVSTLRSLNGGQDDKIGL
jgi:hypothetical protein